LKVYSNLFCVLKNIIEAVESTLATSLTESEMEMVSILIRNTANLPPMRVNGRMTDPMEKVECSFQCIWVVKGFQKVLCQYKVFEHGRQEKNTLECFWIGKLCQFTSLSNLYIKPLLLRAQTGQGEKQDANGKTIHKGQWRDDQFIGWSFLLAVKKIKF